MIDKSIRQHYESGQLVKPGRGRPGYQGKESSTASDIKYADMSREEFERAANEAGIGGLDLIQSRYQGQEYLDDLSEIGKGAGKVAYSPKEKAAIKAGTLKPELGDLTNFLYKSAADPTYKEDLTIEALKKGRKKAGAVDYIDAIMKNVVAQNPEVKGILEKSLDLGKKMLGTSNFTTDTGKVSLKSAATGIGKKFVTNTIAKKLGATGLLAGLGPIGWLIGSWIANRAVDKFTGKGKDKGVGFAQDIDTEAWSPTHMKDAGVERGTGDKFGAGLSGNVSLAGLIHDKQYGAGSYEQANIDKLASKMKNVIYTTDIMKKKKIDVISKATPASGVSQINIDKAKRDAMPEHLGLGFDDKAVSGPEEYEHEGAISITDPDKAIPGVPDVIGPRGDRNGEGGGAGYAAAGGSGMHGGKHYSKGGRIDKPLTGRSRYL